ncbi:Kelch repeat-containing protein [Pseudomonas lactucae]|nr:kelch repeat-containing protein [Pseudomonas lactucae]
MRTPLPVGRDTCGAVLLMSGDVLVVAGSNAGMAIGDTHLYDVSTDLWRAAGQLRTPRFAHTTTLLESGRVLVVGGNNLQFTGGQVQDSVELYDPNAQEWQLQGWLPVDCMDHTATLLQNERVLIVGGYSGRQNAALARAFIYDPSAVGHWSEVCPPPVPLMQHTATLLQEGRVLVCGGANEPFGSPQRHAFIYDPSLDSWERTSMCIDRKGHTATRLATGEVVVVGASSIGDPGSARTAELYDPLSGQWRLTAPLLDGRFGHSASCLCTGQVLIAGGARPVSHPTPLSSAELFTLTSQSLG